MNLCNLKFQRLFSLETKKYLFHLEPARRADLLLFYNFQGQTRYFFKCYTAGMCLNIVMHSFKDRSKMTCWNIEVLKRCYKQLMYHSKEKGSLKSKINRFWEILYLAIII